MTERNFFMFSGLDNLSKVFNTLLITAAVIVAVSIVLIIVGVVLKAIAEEKSKPKRKLHNLLIVIGFTLMGSIGLIFLTIVCIQI